MDRDNVVVAPQFEDIEAAYSEWHSRYAGDREAFYRFMTSPSVERESFLRVLDGISSGTVTGDMGAMYKTEIL